MKTINKYLIVFIFIVLFSTDLYRCDPLSSTDTSPSTTPHLTTSPKEASTTPSSTPHHTIAPKESSTPASTTPPTTKSDSTHPPLSSEPTSSSSSPTPRHTTVPKESSTPITPTTSSHKTPKGKPTTATVEDDSSSSKPTSKTNSTGTNKKSPGKSEPLDTKVVKDCKNFNITAASLASTAKVIDDEPLENFVYYQENVVIKDDVIYMYLNQSDSDIPFTGAKIESRHSGAYGHYICKVDPTTLKGTKTRCVAFNGVGDTYTEIFFEIVGKSDDLYELNYGFYVHKNRQMYRARDNLRGVMNTFGFTITNTSIEFIMNQNSFPKFTRQTVGDNALPRPPFKYFVSIEKDKNTDIDIDEIHYTKLYQLSYDSTSCVIRNDTNGDDEEFYPDPKSPLTYFTTKCVYDKIEWIYNDTIGDGWIDASTGTRQNNTEQIEYIKRGESSFKFDMRNDTNIHFRKAKPFPLSKYKFLMFWFNGGSVGGPRMNIQVISDFKNIVAQVNLDKYIQNGIQKNIWYKVIIPLESLSYDPENVTHITGFVFQPELNDLTEVYIDDLLLSNGTNCYDQETALPFYKQGKLLNANSDGASGAVDISFNGRNNQFMDKKTKKKFNTIEWVLRQNSKGIINFENGTITPLDYDALTFTLYYEPRNEYGYKNEINNPKPMKSSISVRVGDITYRGIGLSEYVGGEYPIGVWIEFVIPFADFSCGEADPISSIEMASIGEDIQGIIYISKIQAVKYLDPPKEESSNAFKNPTNFTIMFIFILIIKLIL